MVHFSRKPQSQRQPTQIAAPSLRAVCCFYNQQPQPRTPVHVHAPAPGTFHDPCSMHLCYLHMHVLNLNSKLPKCTYLSHGRSRDWQLKPKQPPVRASSASWLFVLFLHLPLAVSSPPPRNLPCGMGTCGCGCQVPRQRGARGPTVTVGGVWSSEFSLLVATAGWLHVNLPFFLNKEPSFYTITITTHQ